MKTTRQGFHSIAEAKKEYRRILQEFEKGERIRRQTETFEDIFHLWVKVYETQVEQSTFLKTSQLFKNHILPALGKYKIDKINTLLCQEFIFDITSKISKTSQIKSYTSLVLDFAVTLNL